MGLSADEISKITAYLDASTPLPEKADLIFIPGTRLGTPTDIAADLFKQGVASTIVVTGGEKRTTGEHEAVAHYNILIKAGVPTEHIIIESHSTNTLENVTFALPLIDKRLSLQSLTSILVIAKWMHSRRVLMTLKRHLPQGIRYYARTYAPAGITQDNWFHDPRAQFANVLKNWEHIPHYLAQDHIEEVVRDGDCYI